MSFFNADIRSSELESAGKITISTEISTPDQPSDGTGYLYTKSDGKIYWRSYDVTETDLTSGGGGGAISSVANGSDNRIATFSGSDTLNGEANMTFDGSSLIVTNTTTSSASQGGFIKLVSNDGSTMASGHRLGVIEFAGAEDSSSTITVGSRIESVCDDDWTALSNPASLHFYTTNGNATQTSQLTLKSDGMLFTSHSTTGYGTGFVGTESNFYNVYIKNFGGEIQTRIQIDITGLKSNSIQNNLFIGSGSGVSNYSNFYELDKNINGLISRIDMICQDTPTIDNTSTFNNSTISFDIIPLPELFTRNEPYSTFSLSDSDGKIFNTSSGFYEYYKISTDDLGGGGSNAILNGINASNVSHRVNAYDVSSASFANKFYLADNTGNQDTTQYNRFKNKNAVQISASTHPFTSPQSYYYIKNSEAGSIGGFNSGYFELSKKLNDTSETVNNQSTNGSIIITGLSKKYLYLNRGTFSSGSEDTYTGGKIEIILYGSKSFQ
tara:strand:- start:1160 stop:2650 length:1491 start_codon:yes stop_codon:yes gene_type:complete